MGVGFSVPLNSLSALLVLLFQLCTPGRLTSAKFICWALLRSTSELGSVSGRCQRMWKRERREREIGVFIHYSSVSQSLC